MCGKFPSLLYLRAFFPDTLRSLQQVCLSLRSTCKVSQKCRRKCHRSMHKRGTVTKAKSLFVGSLEISSKKSSHCKMSRIFATKIQWPQFGRIPGAGWGWGVGVLLYVGHMGMYFCSPKDYGFSIEPLLQNNHKILSFL